MSLTILDKVEFLCNHLIFQLEINEEKLYLKCIKKLNSLNPRSLVNLSKSISLVNIISVEHGPDVWKVDTKVKSLLECNMKSLLNRNTSKCHCLTINTYHITTNKHRRIQSFKLQTFFEKNVAGCFELIDHKILHSLDKNKIQRPKRLLVFVNPFGGHKKAVPVYENVAAPIFKLARVEVTKVVTEHRNHARDYVQSANLSEFDGIVAVGGDGMANELINGVLMAAQTTNGISLDDDSESLCTRPPKYMPAQIKLGLIPAGSTNCLSYVTQGNDDPQSATIQIISGESHLLDVCSIHDDFGKFVRFSFSMTSYGFFGQVLRKSENMRKLGPRRYDVAGVNTFAQMKPYSSEVTYFLSSPENPVKVSKDNTRCRFPCETCSKAPTSFSASSVPIDAIGVNLEEEDAKKAIDYTSNNGHVLGSAIQLNSKQADGHVLRSAIQQISKDASGLSPSASHLNREKVTKGKFMMINSAMNACFCAKCPIGLSPSAHLADGYLDLILLSCTSKAELFRYLLSHTGKANRFDFRFVEVHRVQGFRHKALTENSQATSHQSGIVSLADETNHNASDKPVHSCWNTDGEIIDNPNIILWAHRGLINLFARGVE